MGELTEFSVTSVDDSAATELTIRCCRVPLTAEEVPMSHPVSSHNRVRGCIECATLIGPDVDVYMEVYCSQECEENRRSRFNPTGTQAAYLRMQERRKSRRVKK